MSSETPDQRALEVPSNLSSRLSPKIDPFRRGPNCQNDVALWDLMEGVVGFIMTVYETATMYANNF